MTHPIKSAATISSALFCMAHLCSHTCDTRVLVFNFLQLALTYLYTLNIFTFCLLGPRAVSLSTVASLLLLLYSLLGELQPVFLNH